MEEREIAVRSLSGESITISISSTKTIADLKLILKHRFPPASSSDFHLFLRGMKLGIKSQIGSHSISSGDFVALMPFTKKEKSQNLQSEGSGVASKTTPQSETSNLAESAWRDMMEDLSCLSNTMSSEEQPGCLPDRFSDKSKGDMMDENHTSNYARKRRKISQVESKAGISEDLLSSLLHSSKQHVLDQDVCEKFLKVLEYVHCFSDAETGNCMLLSKVDMQENAQLILAGFLQVNYETVTFDLVKNSLDKLREHGFCASVEDLKRLPDLCPKISYQLICI